MKQEQPNSYPELMAAIQDPEDHPANSLPPASDSMWGNELGQDPIDPRAVDAIRMGRDDSTSNVKPTEQSDHRVKAKKGKR